MSSEEDKSQKTEEPTQKKLDDARKEGQVPLSKEVNNWVVLFASAMVIAMVLPSVMTHIRSLLAFYIEKSYSFDLMAGGAYAILGRIAGEVFFATATIYGALVLAAFLAPFVQIGPLFSAKSIMPKLEKISLKKGFERIFSKNSIMEFLKGLLKITIIGVVGFMIVSPYYSGIDHMVGLSLDAILSEMMGIFLRMITGILLILVVVAAIDLSFQRKQHHEKMKMSKQEIKDEHKQTEGDPHVKGRLRQLRAEKARKRMMQAVPNADVVITNPTHFAIALKYDLDVAPAPICVAKGTDELAQRIKAVARESGVEIVENKPLARALYDVMEVDEMIPTEHFQAVAEVISYVFKRKGKI